jgi:hypothetical protein
VYEGRVDANGSLIHSPSHATKTPHISTYYHSFKNMAEAVMGFTIIKPQIHSSLQATKFVTNPCSRLVNLPSISMLSS